jgi:hypothetical protein
MVEKKEKVMAANLEYWSVDRSGDRKEVTKGVWKVTNWVFPKVVRKEMAMACAKEGLSGTITVELLVYSMVE